MKKVKITLLVFSILIIFPVITLLVLSEVHTGPAHKRAIDFLNQEFGEDITFDDFSFSYLRHFPNVHIKVENVRVLDRKKEVAALQELHVVIAPSSLWKREVNISKVVISGGMLHSEIDSLGNKPQLLARKQKPSGGAGSGIRLNIDSQDIEVRNSKVFFGNQVKHNRTYLLVKEAGLNLMVRDSLITLTGSLDGHLDSLISNNTVLFAGQPVKGEEIDFKVNLRTGEKVLDNGYLLAHTLKLFPRFRMTPRDDGQLIELHISGDSTFDNFLELFEFHLGIDLQQTNPEAELRLSYNQVGFVNPFLRPYSELDFEITDADFNGSDLPYPIKNVHIDGNYNNGEGHSPETVQLVIDTIHAEVQNSFINARLKLANLDDPIIDAHFISSLDISHLIKETDNISFSGIIDADLVVNGRISELKALHLEGKQQAKGSITVKDLELFIRDQGLKIELVSGSSLLNNHLFEVTSLLGAYNESAFHFKGLFENLDQYILDENQQLDGSFVLSFDRLDLRKLSPGKGQQQADKKPGGVFSLPDLILDLDLSGREILTDYGPVKDFHMVSHLEKDAVSISKLDFSFQDGRVDATGGVGFDNNGISFLDADIKGDFRNLELDFASNPGEEKQERSGQITLPAYLNAQLDLNIARGSIQGYEHENLSLKANVRGNEISIGHFSVDAMGGHSSLKGRFLLDTAGIKEVSLDGGLSFKQLDLEKIIHDLAPDKPSEPAEGSPAFPGTISVNLDVRAGEIIYKDAVIKNLSTRLIADNERVELSGFHTELPFGSLALDLVMNNYRSEQPNTRGSVNLLIDSLSIDEFMKIEALGIAGKNEIAGEAERAGKNKSIADLPENIELDIKVKARSLVYQNASVQNLDLRIAYLEEKLSLDRLNFSFAGGNVAVNGFLLKNNSESLPGYVYSKVDSLDVRNLFLSFDNFNQDKFTADNSSGKVSWASHYYFELGKDLAPIRGGNLWIMNINVHQAEFDRVEPIEKTLFFVGHKSKDAMIISSLNINAMLYRDKLYFRDVLMNDNIANLDVFGEVDLDNRIMDLGLEISLSDLFFRSKSKRVVQTNEGEVSLDKDAKLFLNLTGPLTDHKLKLTNKRKFNNSRDDLSSEIRKAEKAFKERQLLRK